MTVTATRATAEGGPIHLTNTQRLDSFVTDGVAGNEKTAIGIVHQVGNLRSDHQRSNALCRRWPTTMRSAPICLASFPICPVDLLPVISRVRARSARRAAGRRCAELVQCPRSPWR